MGSTISSRQIPLFCKLFPAQLVVDRGANELSLAELDMFGHRFGLIELDLVLTKHFQACLIAYRPKLELSSVKLVHICKNFSANLAMCIYCAEFILVGNIEKLD